MSRHDDDLHQITRDRLRAVASLRVPKATDRWAGAWSDGGVGEEPIASSAVAAPADVGSGLAALHRARHRDDPPPGASPDHLTHSAAPPPARWWPVEVGPEVEPVEPAAPRRPVDGGDIVGPRTTTRRPAAGRGAPPSVGWSPTDPGVDGDGPATGAADDVDASARSSLPHADAQDVVTRVRAEALAAASAAYADTHGHPLDRAPGALRRRWYLSLRHALVAGAAVTVLAIGMVVRAVVSVPDGPLATTSVTAGDSAAGERAAGEPAGRAAGVGGVGGVASPVQGAAGGAATSGGSAAVAAAGGGGAPATGPPSGSAAGSGTGGPGAGDAGTGVGAAPPSPVVVHVVGQVGRPGIVELPSGSRVADALAVAGGATAGADLSAVNLARVVADGEQIVVPAPGDPIPPAAGPATVGSAAGPGGAAAVPSGRGGAAAAVPVDLNAAGPADLDGLPGIGPVLAQRILDFRAANGPFRHVEELGEVSGIGDALLARLAPLVRV